MRFARSILRHLVTPDVPLKFQHKPANEVVTRRIENRYQTAQRFSIGLTMAAAALHENAC